METTIEEALEGKRKTVSVTVPLSNGGTLNIDGFAERTILTRNQVRCGVSWPAIGRVPPEDAVAIAEALKHCAAEVERLKETV